MKMVVMFEVSFTAKSLCDRLKVFVVLVKIKMKAMKARTMTVIKTYRFFLHQSILLININVQNPGIFSFPHSEFDKSKYKDKGNREKCVKQLPEKSLLICPGNIQ